MIYICSMVNRILNLQKLLHKSSSAFLFGPRGVGKSKLANDYISTHSNVLIYDLLEFETVQRLRINPSQVSKEIESKLKSSKKLFVFIDEVQKVPLILDEVHRLIEAHKGKIQFLLTGSSARKLKREGANLLGGRALNLKLHPISYLEDREMVLGDVLSIGSLPGVIYDNDNPKGSLRSYIEVYLKEEIQQEAIVRNIDKFSRFLEIAAQYHGQIINMTEIAKSAGISPNTVSEYFQILEDTLLAFRLPGWSASIKKQLRFAPKFYLFDNGVCNALRGELNIPINPSTSRYGNLFEAWIVQEAFRINHYYELDLKFSYWHTSNNMEVDLIISRGASKPIAAIEIKSSSVIERKQLSGLISFKLEYPDARRYCVCQTPNAYEVEGVEVINWTQIYQVLKDINSAS
jgi:uncharacterized protein